MSPLGVGVGGIASSRRRGVNPSGEPMPVGNLANFTHLFADDFDTVVAEGDFPDAVSDDWWCYPTGWLDTDADVNGTASRYSTEYVSCGDSIMQLRLHTVAGTPFGAAPVPKIQAGPDPNFGAGLQYGRWAVRFRKVGDMPGWKTAWLLWPDTDLWEDGELDYPEGELESGGTIQGFIHEITGTPANNAATLDTGASYADWHTAIIEWTPSYIDFILDGVVELHYTGIHNPDVAMHWVIQTETSIDGTDPDPGVEGTIEIDWVSVWEYTP